LDGVPFFVHAGRLDLAVQISKQCIELQVVVVTDLTLEAIRKILDCLDLPVSEICFN